METESFTIKAPEGPKLKYYEWACFSCCCRMLRPWWATKVCCLGCGKIIKSDLSRAPKGIEYFKGWLRGHLAYVKWVTHRLLLRQLYNRPYRSNIQGNVAMNEIFLIILSMMGSNTWETRELGSYCFNICCDNNWLTYEQEMQALDHSDLEISHRVELVLEKYYQYTSSRLDPTCRKFSRKYFLSSDTDTDIRLCQAYMKQKELEGWVHLTTYAHNPVPGMCEIWFVRKTEVERQQRLAAEEREKQRREQEEELPEQ